jgi:carboxypeptidase family protein
MLRSLRFGIVVCVALCPVAAMAQSSATGSVAGKVTDVSGGVLPGATVRANNPNTGVTQSTVAGSAGDWLLAALPVGRYELTFELDGFKKLMRGDVLIEASVTREINVTLEVGSVSEQITVRADAPLVVTNTAAIYRRLAAEELTQVPTSTRPPAVPGGATSS